MATLGEKLTPLEAMNLALQEGLRGAGFTSPNPLVGAVILDKNNGLLASGFHEFYGGNHAEVNALVKVKDEQLRGAQVFVTLEPCAHEGKTPSCAKKLAELPISRIFYGVEDPNPLVSGRGIALLKKAGKEVIHLKEIQARCEELAEVFLTNQRKQRAFVALKVASSLDGFIGLKNGESQWITGKEARAHTHYLRGIYDAVCVGAKTFLIDNPKLNIRHPRFANKQNKVVILDERGDLIPKLISSNVEKCHDLKNIYIVQPIGTELNLKSMSEIQRLEVKFNLGLDIKELLHKLYQHKIYSLMVEGGAETYQTFLKARCVDRLYCFLAPSLIGGGQGLPWTKDLQSPTLKEQVFFEKPDFAILGNDILLSTRPKP